MWYGFADTFHRGFLNTDTQINPPHSYRNQSSESVSSPSLPLSDALLQTQRLTNTHTHAHTCLKFQQGWHGNPWSCSQAWTANMVQGLLNRTCLPLSANERLCHIFFFFFYRSSKICHWCEHSQCQYVISLTIGILDESYSEDNK